MTHGAGSIVLSRRIIACPAAARYSMEPHTHIMAWRDVTSSPLMIKLDQGKGPSQPLLLNLASLGYLHLLFSVFCSQFFSASPQTGVASVAWRTLVLWRFAHGGHRPPRTAERRSAVRLRARATSRHVHGLRRGGGRRRPAGEPRTPRKNCRVPPRHVLERWGRNRKQPDSWRREERARWARVKLDKFAG